MQKQKGIERTTRQRTCRVKENEYKLKYLKALRVVMSGAIWNMLFSVIALVMGVIMMLGKVGGAIWIVIVMGTSITISVILIVKSAKKEHEEQHNLLDGDKNE